MNNQHSAGPDNNKNQNEENNSFKSLEMCSDPKRLGGYGTLLLKL